MATIKKKYTTKSCHGTKSEAKKAQKSLHEKGYTAKIVAKDGKHCVQSAGLKKKRKAK